MRFIVREVHFNQIIMSTDFENLDKGLMIEVVRRKQLQQVCDVFRISTYVLV